MRSAVQADRERAQALPTFASVRNSADPEAAGEKERAIDKLRAPGGILGLEQKKRLEEQAKRKQADHVKQYGKYIKEMYIPKANAKKVQEMEKLREKALREN